jgi:hypothetical protein
LRLLGLKVILYALQPTSIKKEHVLLFDLEAIEKALKGG